MISYKVYPIIWKSSLQTEIALSSTESEYTGFSYTLRETIPIVSILKEISGMGFTEGDPTPSVHCKVYEYNSGALEITSEYKYHPRKKLLNMKLHHFRYHVDRGKITIHKIRTEYQPADYLTKPLDEKNMSSTGKRFKGDDI